MPAGLQLFNEQGREILSYTDRITRTVSSTAVNGTAGSVNVGDLKGGAAWFAFLPNSINNAEMTQGFDVGYPPTFTISGSTISWAYAGAAAGTKVVGTLLYGIY